MASVCVVEWEMVRARAQQNKTNSFRNRPPLEWRFAVFPNCVSERARARDINDI